MSTFKVLVVGLLIAVGSCDERATREPETFHLGQITQNDVDVLLNQLNSGDTIIVDSGGGLSNAALLLAQRLSRNDIDVQFEGRCLSACAEFLLVATDRKTISSDLIIGYHHNSHMIADYVAEHMPTKLHCHSKLLKGKERLYKARGMKVSLWQQQASYIGIHRFRHVGGPKECGKITFRTRRSWWYPTRDQLRELVGLDISTPICNDDSNCVRAFILNRYDKLGWYMIGDEPFLLRPKDARKTANFDLQ
jgi:hypothetical protein